MTHLEKNISEMKEEIAALNLEIKRLNAQTRLERARGKAKSTMISSQTIGLETEPVPRRTYENRVLRKEDSRELARVDALY